MRPCRMPRWTPLACGWRRRWGRLPSGWMRWRSRFPCGGPTCPPTLRPRRQRSPTAKAAFTLRSRRCARWMSGSRAFVRVQSAAVSFDVAAEPAALPEQEAARFLAGLRGEPPAAPPDEVSSFGLDDTFATAREQWPQVAESLRAQLQRLIRTLTHFAWVETAQGGQTLGRTAVQFQGGLRHHLVPEGHAAAERAPPAHASHFPAFPHHHPAPRDAGHGERAQTCGPSGKRPARHRRGAANRMEVRQRHPRRGAPSASRYDGSTTDDRRPTTDDG